MADTHRRVGRNRREILRSKRRASQSTPTGAVMAGFVLVSIPTAVVFIACQKIILRGIVLPSMK